MDGVFREPWRYWSRVERVGECWEWRGDVRENGYGFGWNFVWPRGGVRRIYAHRQGWLLGHPGEEIPAGMQLDHLCRNKICVRPEHLEVVTPRENMLRGDTVAARNAAKVGCGKAGHGEYDGVTKQGGRTCSACNREAQARWRAAHAVKVP